MNRIWNFQTPCAKQPAKPQKKSMAVAEPRRITQQMRGDSPTHWERYNTACGPWAVDGTAGTLWNIGNSTDQKHFCATQPGQLLRDAALFYLDWLAEDPKTGKLVSGPSSSTGKPLPRAEHAGRMQPRHGTEHGPADNLGNIYKLSALCRDLISRRPHLSTT